MTLTYLTRIPESNHRRFLKKPLPCQECHNNDNDIEESASAPLASPSRVANVILAARALVALLSLGPDSRVL